MTSPPSLRDAFTEKWVRNHTDEDHTVTFNFKRLDVPYEEESEIQTIHYDKSRNIYVAIDDWGSDGSFETWDSLVRYLQESGRIEKLMEIHLNHS